MRIYEGTENYIFVSYAHKDSDRVVPIIEALDDAGYRVWYDAGIEAGSEWPENVAEHLCNSKVVLVFLSQNALNSQNCTREIHFAVAERKEILVVYLQELSLTAGMRMQLGTSQAIFRNRYSSLQEFIQALSAAKILKDCQSKNALPAYASQTAYSTLPQQSSTKGFVFSKEETYRSAYTGEVYRCCAVAPQEDFETKYVSIPERSDSGIPVGRIQREAFLMSSKIESVHIPHSVRVIDEGAFDGCFHLKTLSIKNGVELIEKGAFRNCDSLQRIIFPRSLKKIEDRAFDGCEALEHVELPEGLEHIGESAFGGCNFRSIFIPKSVKTIEFLALGLSSIEMIYCEVEHRPAGWGDYCFGFFDANKIVWGISREQAQRMQNK